MIKEKIGFIGSGQIAGSLAVGFTGAGLVDDKQIYASDPFEGSRRAFAKIVPGSTLMDDNRRLAAEVDVLFWRSSRSLSPTCWTAWPVR